ncbi:MAG: class I SAM-dependent methyltransferase [Bacteroidetes bacterium]|nr:class I SAM-dependent methyltransferase [Bacteroidota bacterium]
MTINPLNYDNIAFWYDSLSKVTFLGSQQRIQRKLIPALKDGDRMLIIGGGSGWILEDINRLSRQNIEITYIEESERMLEMTKKRQFNPLVVNIIQADIFEYSLLGKYDIIFTPFIFDHFNLQESQILFDKLNSHLTSGGLWLHTDFTYESSHGKWWKRLYMSVIFLFFKWVIGLKNNTLTNMEPIFQKENYQCLYKKYTYMNFIQGSIWEKE